MVSRSVLPRKQWPTNERFIRAWAMFWESVLALLTPDVRKEYITKLVIHPIWTQALRGKYVWSFDCGYARCDPFFGFFGVNSVNLVGKGPPVHLQVLFGVRCPAENGFRPFWKECLLDLVIEFLGPFQDYMLKVKTLKELLVERRKALRETAPSHDDAYEKRSAMIGLWLRRGMESLHWE